MKTKTAVTTALTGLALALSAALISMENAYALEGSKFEPAVRSQFGVVVSSNQLASEAGRDVLRHGGNAVDAAISTLFTIGVTQPGQCGLGGGFEMLWRGAHGQVGFLQALGRTPAAAKPDTVGADPDGLDVAGYGHRVIGVPGLVNGAAEALERLGTISLAQAVAPAEKAAREGFRITANQSAAIAAAAPWLSKFQASAAIFLVGGKDPLPAGATLVQSDLAWTLRQIAHFGPKVFYRGVIADKIIAEMRKPPIAPGDEAILTARDLARDEPIWQVPLMGRYRGHTIWGAPPPSSGAVLIETLNILDGFDLASFGPSSADELFVMAEAQKIAFEDVTSVLADPAFFKTPVHTLTSQAFANRRRSLIDLKNAQVYTASDELHGHPLHGPKHSGHTTHISVIDRWGNGVSLTCSLYASFGSAVVAEGTGVLLNDAFVNAGPPGHPNQLEGRKILANEGAPTIVTRGGQLVLVVGAAGSERISRGVAGIVVNYVDFGMDIAHAVDAERYFGYQDELGPYAIGEDGRISPMVRAALEARGQYFDFGFGEYAPGTAMARVEVAGIDPVTGDRLGAPDPRGEGSAAGQ